jgi:DNA-binding CsgD family transcriptional regulator
MADAFSLEKGNRAYQPKRFRLEEVMDNQKQFDQSLGLIYESAITPERLKDALIAITTMLDGDTCHLVGWDRQTAIPSLSVSTGLPENVGPEYAAHYAHIDPRRQLALTHAPGQLLACHEHFDARFVSRNEFFQDYLLPQVGIHYLLGANDLIAESEQMVLIGFQRYVGHGPFESAEINLLQRLLPHVRRSLKMAKQIGAALDAKVLSEKALDLSNLAVLALSSAGAVVWANRRGEALLRQSKWLSQRNGQLRALNPDGQTALKSTLADTLMTGRPGNLSFHNGAEHCSVTLLALRDRNPLEFRSKGAQILALVTTTSHQRLASVQQLMDHFNLSPAEARFVRALAHGESIDEYARHEGLKRSTVKSHLLSALAKTGMKAQKDVVRLVFTLPAIRS